MPSSALAAVCITMAVLGICCTSLGAWLYAQLHSVYKHSMIRAISLLVNLPSLVIRTAVSNCISSARLATRMHISAFDVLAIAGRSRIPSSYHYTSKHFELDTAAKMCASQNEDMLLHATMLALEEYNKQSFQHYANSILLEASPQSRTVWLHDETVPVRHGLRRNGRSVKARFKLAWVREELAHPILMVEHASQWVPFHYWLTNLPTPTAELIGEEGFQILWEWWSQNGKQVSLHMLPKAVIERIVELADRS